MSSAATVTTASTGYWPGPPTTQPGRVAAADVTHDGGRHRPLSAVLAVDERALPEGVVGQQVPREVGIQGHQAGGREAHPHPLLRGEFLAFLVACL